MSKTCSGEIRMIPVDRIEVLNHRERNAKVFEEIAGNIHAIGLKKPITVTPRPGPEGEEHYLLVCGEGRLNAFKAMRQPTIPALVVNVSDEDAFIMSLAENIARRQCRPLEILAGIKVLHDQGYDKKTISAKTGLTAEYVGGILTLLQHGEERLLVAVQKGRIPLNTALSIVGSGSDDRAIQTALQQAYELGDLRGKQLLEAKKVLERRMNLGRTVDRGTPRKRMNVTPSSLVRTYQREVERQRLLVKKAEFAQQRLLFVTGALRQLFSDENFGNLMRAEGLDTLPKYLAERIGVQGGAV
ncbi:plasmid partitioning protein RepB C-terminal domain-containing protein [Solimonas sp. SE-A11]|uniref:plasmid partitioning protein RepB C-terminal domain-containing protein n=1 Tax=Solimonas sp. SE-A11 TaxID=3054954 RepID=UPI00259D19F0|nr:plasmid partitioning protein RepB C-terminal domain-containing protein [Solimonas sp. SE-A11]MDM4772850.1 plasmid partitioning protein RepB C-terminal domain-containing protein [Solimonas sp. SE-A11]